MAEITHYIPPDSTIGFRLPARLADIRLLGISVHALFGSLGFDETRAFQLELAVVEAANNIVLHAYGEGEDHMIEMELAVTRNRVTCTFVDQGRAADFLHQQVVPSPEEEEHTTLRENHRGVAILQKVMDEVDYTRRGGHNILTLVKYLPPQR